MWIFPFSLFCLSNDKEKFGRERHGTIQNISSINGKINVFWIDWCSQLHLIFCWFWRAMPICDIFKVLQGYASYSEKYINSPFLSLLVWFCDSFSSLFNSFTRDILEAVGSGWNQRIHVINKVIPQSWKVSYFYIYIFMCNLFLVYYLVCSMPLQHIKKLIICLFGFRGAPK